MISKQTLSKKIDMSLQDVFWISYILFTVLAPVVAFGAFIAGLYYSFFP